MLLENLLLPLQHCTLPLVHLSAILGSILVWLEILYSDECSRKKNDAVFVGLRNQLLLHFFPFLKLPPEYITGPLLRCMNQKCCILD